MFDKLALIEKHYEELEQMIAQPEIATNQKQLQGLTRERANLKDIVIQYQQYKALSDELTELEALLNNDLEPEMIALIKEEQNKLEQRRNDLIGKLKLSLLPKDQNDDKDVIVEIRAGAGGEEASLFAADLFRMYSHYAQRKGWHTNIMNSNQSDIGGFKEVIFEVKGKGAFSKLKYERGVHRVQRVPITEASGRIHTSTATVVVLPEAEEIELNIKLDDLRVDIFHSHGAGGQNVNKVATAVRITHIPTGITATCQDERSQLKNKMKAMAVLRARLFDVEQRKRSETIEKERRTQVGRGDRAEKIRTYNFPQDRVTDHRINVVFHNLTQLLNGELDELIEALSNTEQAQQLEAVLS
ncbi:MAG: peptide chain release factor 1 [Chloroflexi bacterium CG_4_10_14_0_8_um_filter_46_9]|nr:MAG: peptide chain release factor 1 [Dehalococcoidia bacterium CG2_30_46_19]PIZ26899.1 MAG: peptide chain release factor 1 [Chloroflexi bacterium CG_4_10_14_0_8_um_filter_46_9]